MDDWQVGTPTEIIVVEIDFNPVLLATLRGIAKKDGITLEEVIIRSLEEALAQETCK
jgi:hypothetical protein